MPSPLTFLSTFAGVDRISQKPDLDFHYQLSWMIVGNFTLSHLTSEDIFSDPADLASVTRAAGLELLQMDAKETPFDKVDCIVAFHQAVVREINESEKRKRERTQGKPPSEEACDKPEKQADVSYTEIKESAPADADAPVDHPLIDIPASGSSDKGKGKEIHSSVKGRDVVPSISIKEALIAASPTGASPAASIPDSPDGFDTSSVSSDTLFPVLIYLLVRINPPRCIANLQYILNYLPVKLVDGYKSYCLTNFSAMISFLQAFNLKTLDIPSHLASR